MRSGEPGALLVIEMLPDPVPAAVGAYFVVNVVACPAFRVKGVVRPLMLNPVPLALAADIVVLAVPVLVNVTVTELLVFTSTLPKLTLVGFAERPGCVPVPLTETTTVGSEPPLVASTVTLPLVLPAAVGANCTVKLVLFPAGRFSGVASPLTLNPVPLALTFVIVALAVPELLSVTVCRPFAPRAMFPKAMLSGFAFSDAFPFTPVPLRLRVCGELPAVSVKVTDPVTVFAVLGENWTENERLCPALMVAGRESPLTPKALPFTVARFTTTLVLPVFVRFTDWLEFCVTETLPKLTEEGESARPAAVPVPANEIDIVESEASLVTENVPLAAPVAVGAN